METGEVEEETSVDTGAEWDGEFDDSVTLIQILGIPGETDDLGLEWTIEEASGSELSFKLFFTKPLKISQGDDVDYVFVLLNLDQFKDVDGNSLGTNTLVRVLLPRMVEEGQATETLKSTGATAGSSSKVTVIANFIMNIFMSASLNQLWGMINGL